MVSDTPHEIQKLHDIDLGVGKWLSEHVPDAVPDYIHYLIQTYKHIGVTLNYEKLEREFDILRITPS